jgi:succinate dehydrogenase / fumarate reductase, cytochrome b subunit
MSSYITSSVAKKYIMALTGIPLMLFIFGHMLGNLQIFIGADALNNYAATLQGLGGFLWVIRITLFALFITHAILSSILYVENKIARPVSYHKPATVVATLTSRTMIITGLIVVCFLVFHIFHYTVQSVDPSFKHLFDSQGRHDVYTMLIQGFSNSSITSIYLLGVVLLGAHIHHAASSALQSLGLMNHKYAKVLNIIGPIMGIIVAVGYAVVPLCVLFKVLR